MRKLIFIMIYLSALLLTGCVSSMNVISKIEDFHLDNNENILVVEYYEKVDDPSENYDTGSKISIEGYKNFNLKPGTNRFNLGDLYFYKPKDVFKFSVNYIQPKSYTVYHIYYPVITKGIKGQKDYSPSYYSGWDGKRMHNDAEKIKITEFKAWDIKEIFKAHLENILPIYIKKLKSNRINLEIIDSETLIPLPGYKTNCKLIINNIEPNGKYQLTSSEIKNDLLTTSFQSTRMFDYYINDFVAKVNSEDRWNVGKPYSPTISRENGEDVSKYSIQMLRKQGQQDSLDITIRAEGYEYFRGKVYFSNTSEQNYIIKLPRLGSKVKMEIIDKTKASIYRKEEF